MTSGQIVGTPDALRRVLGTHQVGLVPTMGALHRGHVALIERAAAENEVAAVSIFVNPTQFTNSADLAGYPRTLERDAEVAIQAGCPVIYAPTADAIYPSGFTSSVHVRGMSEILEGVDRPGHFTGVATVVAILLNTFRPARAYFGEKDYQQLAIIRQMHGDLQLPGDIVSCPTIRDVDGLALSSRNARLSATARATAAVIPRALDAISKAYWSGIHERVELRSIGLQTLESAPAVTVRYLELVVADSLALANTISADTRVLVAVEIDGVRLIDNIALGRGIQSS